MTGPTRDLTFAEEEFTITVLNFSWNVVPGEDPDLGHTHLHSCSCGGMELWESNRWKALLQLIGAGPGVKDLAAGLVGHLRAPFLVMLSPHVV